MPASLPKSPFSQGWDAGKLGQSDRANPYDPDSFAWNEWNDGHWYCVSGKFEKAAAESKSALGAKSIR